jgi:hypothetical protein
VPIELPVTTPAKETVATAGFADTHVPPGVAQPSVVERPTQTAGVPVMGETPALTVIVIVPAQPVAAMYEIIAVPGETPETTPAAEIVAMPEGATDQAPPVTVVVYVAGVPIQTIDDPKTAGVGVTVTGTVA